MPNFTATAGSSNPNSHDCGREVARLALDRLLRNTKPAVAIVFAAIRFRMPEVLKGISEVLGAGVPVVGCTSAGEFADNFVSNKSVVIMLIGGDQLDVMTGVGTGLKADSAGAVGRMFSSLRKRTGAPKAFVKKGLLLFSDGLAGNGEKLVDNVFASAGSTVDIAGGAAGDGGLFKETFVMQGGQVHKDAVVGLELGLHSPMGVGVAHGWCPSKVKGKVTKAAGGTLFEVDGKPAYKIYEAYAAAIHYPLSRSNAGAFMMNNELGVITADQVKIRAPLKLNDDDSISMASEIHVGAEVSVVEGKCEALIAAATQATRTAMAGLKGAKAAGVIVFDCVARKAVLQDEFQKEVDAIKKVAGDVPVIGFNTYGEIAKVAGQPAGFHNTTDVVCVIPA
jgi:methyl-accepting chemotaxis protein